LKLGAAIKQQHPFRHLFATLQENKVHENRGALELDIMNWNLKICRPNNRSHAKYSLAMLNNRRGGWSFGSVIKN